MLNYFRNPILTCYRRPLRRAHHDQEDEESQEEVQEVSEGEGLQEAEEVYAAAAASVQAQVLHADSAAAGGVGADSRHHGVRRVLLRPLRCRTRPPEEPPRMRKHPHLKLEH